MIKTRKWGTDHALKSKISAWKSQGFGATVHTSFGFIRLLLTYILSYGAANISIHA